MKGASFARVGVVIVTHASANDVVYALSALPTGELARVVVVDNGSPDETVAVVRGLGLANVEVVEQDNLGFGAGNDAGRRHLPPTAEFVLFLNPDCVIESADLSRLVGYLDAHPGTALAGPRLRDSDGAPRTAGGVLPSPRTELQPHLPGPLGRLVTRRQFEPGRDRSQPAGYVEGACMLARLSTFDAVGGFDHRYFLCFEEIDLAKRLGDGGWRVDLCAESWATHAGQRSRSQAAGFSLYHQYRSQVVYLERWFGRGPAKRYARAAIVSWWLRRRTGRVAAADYRILRAAVSGADFPE